LMNSRSSLGRAEVESCMALLFAIASKDLTSEQRARVRNKIGEASSEALTTALIQYFGRSRAL